MIVTVYSIDDNDTGTPLYIGVTQDFIGREKEHRYSAKRLNYPIYVHIRDNNVGFSLNEIENFEVVNRNQILFWENFWVEQFKAWGFSLFNRVKISPKFSKRNVFGEQALWLKAVSLGLKKPTTMNPAFFNKIIE